MIHSLTDPRPLAVWLARAGLLGAAAGAVLTAGGMLVLGDGGASALARSLVLATAVGAVAVGVWAGSPHPEEVAGRLVERSLAAGAVTALGSSFATFRLLYEPLLPGPWWEVGTLLLVIAIPVYAAGMVAPSLAAAAEAGAPDDDREASDPDGALLVGGLAGVAIGAVLAALPAASPWAPTFGMLGAAVAYVVGLALPGARGPEVQERDLYRTVSAFSELRVTEVVYPGERQPERRLYLNDEEESSELVRSGAPTLAYIAAAEAWLRAITPAGARYLFLGGGAYTLPRRVVERDRRASVLVVELDPEVTRIARRFFGLNPAHGIDTVHGDARAYLQQAAPDSFDRIYVDVYGGDERLPYSLLTLEAAQAMARAVGPEGVVAANVIAVATGDEQRQLWSIVGTFAEAFPNVALYSHLGPDYPDRQNFLLAGTRDTAREFPPRAGTFDLWPRDAWPAVDGTVVYRDLTTPPAPSAPRPAPRRPAHTTAEE